MRSLPTASSTRLWPGAVPTGWMNRHTLCWVTMNVQGAKAMAVYSFFLAGALCLSAGRGVLRLTRLPRHDRGLEPGGNRSAASCLCTVLRRALYHYSTRSPKLWQFIHGAC